MASDTETERIETAVIPNVNVLGPRKCNILSINKYSWLSFLYQPVQQLREVGDNGSLSFTCISLILFVLTKFIVVGYNLYYGLKVWDDVSIGAVRNIANNSDGYFWRIFAAILIIPGSYQYIIIVLNFVLLCIQLEEELQWMLPVIFMVAGLSGNMIAAVNTTDLYTVGPAHCVAAMDGALLVDICFYDRIHWIRAILTLGGEVLLIMIYDWYVQKEWWSEIESVLIGFLLTAAYRITWDPNNLETYYFTLYGKRVNKIQLQMACFAVVALLFFCNFTAMQLTYNRRVASLPL